MTKQSINILLQQSLPFYKHLNTSERELLIQNTMFTEYKAGQPLHQGDNDCIGLLIIQKGSIRTYLLSEEGREVTLYRLNDKDVCILSASCVLKTITFDVFIEAETDCTLLMVPSSAFLTLSSSNIYVEAYMYKLATERFSDVMWTMQQIAKYLGSAREVVSRMLKYFSTEGILTLSRGKITITDKKKLRSLL